MEEILQHLVDNLIPQLTRFYTSQVVQDFPPTKTGETKTTIHHGIDLPNDSTPSNIESIGTLKKKLPNEKEHRPTNSFIFWVRRMYIFNSLKLNLSEKPSTIRHMCYKSKLTFFPYGCFQKKKGYPQIIHSK